MKSSRQKTFLQTRLLFGLLVLVLVGMVPFVLEGKSCCQGSLEKAEASDTAEQENLQTREKEREQNALQQTQQEEERNQDRLREYVQNMNEWKAEASKIREKKAESKDEARRKFQTFSTQALTHSLGVITRFQTIIERAHNFSTQEKAEALAQLENTKEDLLALQSKLKEGELTPKELRSVGQKIREATRVLRTFLYQKRRQIWKAKLAEAVERVSSAISRVESKVSQLDVDVSSLETILKEAKSYLSQAETALENNGLEKAKDLLKKVRQTMGEFRSALEEVLENNAS
ncbi:hypothetical protein J7K05_02060 [bacterium]|nr:hypothetical protein [bacterium]